MTDRNRLSSENGVRPAEGCQMVRIGNDGQIPIEYRLERQPDGRWGMVGNHPDFGEWCEAAWDEKEIAQSWVDLRSTMQRKLIESTWKEVADD